MMTGLHVFIFTRVNRNLPVYFSHTLPCLGRRAMSDAPSEGEGVALLRTYPPEEAGSTDGDSAASPNRPADDDGAVPATPVEAAAAGEAVTPLAAAGSPASQPPARGGLAPDASLLRKVSAYENQATKERTGKIIVFADEVRSRRHLPLPPQ